MSGGWLIGGLIVGALLCVAAAIAHLWRVGRELVGPQ